ncbi:hypothetical protein NX779_02375 [Mycoplasma cottewii]|uniref:Uncharacterized protein n=1 Tax=Mycoplasma cottewii TaxID=51364 RepID=A0ABY5TVE5_9MOLU|nr:hypothetical protein [Mycoplasma cottewii]UWD34640.1 hypothetical protein NX779_02375 [Mycoplasma cottewii]
MKLKFLIPLFSGLTVGGSVAGGTMYGIKTMNSNSQMSNLVMQFEKKLRECERLKQDLISKVSETNRIKGELEKELKKTVEAAQDNLASAKSIYENVVKLTKQTTSLEQSNVTYYLVYLGVTGKSVELKSSESVKTKLEENEKELPTTIENLLSSGFDFKTLMSVEKDYDKLILRDQIKAVLTISNSVLTKVEQANAKLINYFQTQINELTKLKNDITVFNSPDFIELIGKLEPQITKQAWEAMSPLEKFIKIKTLFAQLKIDYDVLSKTMIDRSAELQRLNERLQQILNGFGTDTLITPNPSTDESTRNS